MIEELAHSFATMPIEGFVSVLRGRLQQLGVSMVDGQVIGKPAAEALVAQVIELVRGSLLGTLAERPADALRVLDALRSTGYTELEPQRAHFERERARRFPPPPPVTWKELAELHALAASDPEHCRVGPPVTHVEFAARLAEAGSDVPSELLALYAACSHVTLTCRRVAASAGSIPPGEALRVRDGRLILFERVRRHPAMLFVEQPGISIVSAIGTWWLVLEDDRAPASKRPLDLQGVLRFALRRMDAPSLEVLLTDLAWHRFFT